MYQLKNNYHEPFYDLHTRMLLPREFSQRILLKIIVIGIWVLIGHVQHVSAQFPFPSPPENNPANREINLTFDLAFSSFSANGSQISVTLRINNTGSAPVAQTEVLYALIPNV